MKSSTIKNYFNAAAEGNVELLRSYVNTNPQLLKQTNKNTSYTSIYYAVKNMKKDATIFLIKNGLRLTNKELNSLIGYEWYGGLGSYYFLLEISSDLFYSDLPGISQIDLKVWLQKKYISTYFTHRNIDRLIKFLESTNKNVNWQDILDQYLKYSGDHSRNSNHLTFVRELKLRVLT